MPWDLLIRNGQAVLRGGAQPMDIAVENEKIVEIAPELRGSAREEIDASGLHVFPGLIDPHVHFNEPGRTDWEGFDTGTAALAAGGGTCFFDMPLNSSPPTLDAKSFDLKLEAAQRSSRTDFALWGGLTPNNLDTMEELAERGVIGFKAFMCPSGIDDFTFADHDTLLKGMTIAATLRLPVAVHAEDLLCLEKQQREIQGRSWDDYLKSRPVACENVAIRIAIETARLAKCSLHVVHVSSQFGVDVIQFERKRDVDVTCETCPHYLLLCDEDVKQMGARAKCSPPLREREWQTLLWSQLNGGEIDFVGSDHSPAPASMKTGDDAFAIWGGISGVQSTMSSLFSGPMELPLPRVAELTSSKVAERFGISGKGQIETGFDADLMLIDIGARYTLTREMLLDRHKLSPYVGREFRGLVKRTIVRGHTVFQDGKVVGNFRGRLITPHRRVP